MFGARFIKSVWSLDFDHVCDHVILDNNIIFDKMWEYHYEVWR